MKYNPFSVFSKITYDYKIPVPPKPSLEEKPVINEDYLKHYIDITAEEVAKKCKTTATKIWKVLTIINVIIGLIVSVLTLINILKG